MINAPFSRLLVELPFGLRLHIHVWCEGADRLELPRASQSWTILLPLRGTFIEKRWSLDDAPLDSGVFSWGRHTFASASFRRPGVPYFCPSRTVRSFAPVSDEYAASLVLSGRSR